MKKTMWFFNKKQIPHLPAAKGPFVPGCIDLMLEYASTGIFARLYYPTKLKHHEIDSFQWMNWLADGDYIGGIGKAVMVFPIVVRLLAWWMSVNILRVPALYGERVNTENKLKCIVFSHGYAANRFFASITCNELASRGYLVAVIEHRDQSSSYTYYYKNKEEAVADMKMPIYAKQILFGKDHYGQRNEQVHYRAKECIKLLDFLRNLNDGKIPHNILDDVIEHKKYNFKWEDLIGQLDLSTLTMAGHSFGGATALLVLSQRKEFKQGLLLDPWMFPLKHEENLIENVTQPLLFINSQTFHILPNINAMEKYLTNNNERKMYTILHSTHEVQTDSASVFGYWLNWFMKKLSPATAADINNALILRYLKKYTGNIECLADCELLMNENENVAEGLTKPWAR